MQQKLTTSLVYANFMLEYITHKKQEFEDLANMMDF